MGIASRLRWVPISLVPSLLLGSPRALAQPAPAPAEPPLRVLWTSEDPECDGGEVAGRALALVTPGVVPRPLRASVEVRREGPLWVVRLETQSGEQTGRRILRAESCREIEDALALLLAMTLEARLDPGASEPAPAPAATPPAAAAQPTPASPAPAAPEPAPAEPETPEPDEDDAGPGLFRGVFVRAAGKVGWRQQPGLALGVSGAAGVLLGDFELGASATLWPSTAEPIEQFEDARIHVRRQSLGLRGCWNAWRAGGFAFAPCVTPELTLFHFEAEGLTLPYEGSPDPLFSVGASAELRYELFGGVLALSLGAGVNLEPAQPFQIRDIVDANDEAENAAPTEPLKVYTSKAIGPRLELGVDARF